MNKAFIFLGWLLLFALLALTCWGIALWNGWPAWGALFLYFAMIGFWLTASLTHRLIKAWRARSRTAAVVEKPEPALSVETALKDKWLQGIHLIKNSDLKRLGNPLYVLPWYMVIGPLGSGKSTALMRAQLSSPLKKVDPSTPLPATLNIEWWYFDKAIILDTSGRYVEPEESPNDSREWNKILDLLGHYRAKEGLNGLVVTIEASSLLQPEPAQLAAAGATIRVRIEQLIRLFDQRFPLYILVTQCDLLYGMEAWSRLLPEDSLNQAMGYLSSGDTDWSQKENEFVDAAFEQMGKRLKQLQLQLLERLDPSDSDNHTLLLLPQEFSKLQPGLKLFLKHVQGDSPYLESALLRGLFCCSAVQPGGAISTVLTDIAPPEHRHETNFRGLFLQDIFDRVLPADRYLLRPAAIVNPWRRATQHLEVLAWLTLSSAAGLYLSFSFVHSLNTLNTMQHLYPERPNFTGLLRADTQTLNRFRNFGRWLEQRDAQLLSQFLAFDDQITEVERKIKLNYVVNFRKYVLPSVDEAMDRTARLLVQQGQSDQLTDYIQTLVRRINMFQARIQGANYDTLHTMPPLSGTILLELDPQLSHAAAGYFNAMYIAYLAWMPNDLSQLQQLETLQNTLKRIALDSDDLQWIVSWANAQADLKKLELSDFWQGSRALNTIAISPAFTRDGKTRIDAFMAEVRKSAPSGSDFDNKLAQFNQWYHSEKIKRWQDFSWNFPQGENTLNGENEWRTTVAHLPTPNNPYILLLNRLANEFSDATDPLPPWLQLCQQLFTLRLRAAQKTALQFPATVNDIGGKLLKDIAQGEGISQAHAAFNAQFHAIQLYQAYASALAQAVASEIASAAQATQLAAQFHRYDTDPSAKSPLRDAYTRLSELTTQIGTGQAEEQVAWGLLAGPLQLAVRFAHTQTSCTLQKTWESNVLWPLQSSTAMSELLDQLYGNSGTVWGFLNGPSKPFIQRTANAYTVHETLGQAVPFTPQFMPFINAAVTWQVAQKVTTQLQTAAEKHAALQQQQQKQQLLSRQHQTVAQLSELNKNLGNLQQAAYPIVVTGLPTNVNTGATTTVIGTLLSVQCASAPFSLNNLNFSVSGSFNWSQQTCNNTTLHIRFPTVTLTKHYPGPQGFVTFLQDFQHGSHTFNANEFAGQRAPLEGLGVSTITVRYQFSGQSPLLENNRRQLALQEEINQVVAEQQHLQTALTALEQQILQATLQGIEPNKEPMTIQVPGKIGQCWNTSAAPEDATLSAKKVIDELVATTLAASAPQEAPPR